MARRPSVQTKISRGQGRGEGADYKPWLTANEANSIGTASVIPDWKTGRSVHCLSQGEARWYYILRWNDDNVDIREHYPLWDNNFSNKDTVRIAQQLGVRHPGGSGWIMTTDFLVTEAGGGYHAYSVKMDRKLSDRTVEKLIIEKFYWMSQGVPFTVLYKEDANKILAANIRLVTEFYDPGLVFDAFSAAKHKIAVKEWIVDMEHKIIDTSILTILLEGESVL